MINGEADYCFECAGMTSLVESTYAVAERFYSVLIGVLSLLCTDSHSV